MENRTKIIGIIDKWIGMDKKIIVKGNDYFFAPTARYFTEKQVLSFLYLDFQVRISEAIKLELDDFYINQAKEDLELIKEMIGQFQKHFDLQETPKFLN